MVFIKKKKKVQACVGAHVCGEAPVKVKKGSEGGDGAAGAASPQSTEMLNVVHVRSRVRRDAVSGRVGR